MSVRRLVGLILALAIGVCALAAVVVAIQAAAVHRAQDRLQTVLDPAALLSRQLLGDYVNQETGERGYLITGDPAYLQPYTAGTAAAAADATRLAAMLAGSKDLVAQVQAARNAGDVWAAATAPEVAARRAGNTAEANSIVAAGNGKSDFDQLRTKLEQLQTGIDGERDAAQRTQNSATTVLTVILVVAAALALTAVLLFSVAAFRGIVTPITKLAALLHQVSNGALNMSISGTGPAEIRALARDAETMRARLVDQIDRAQHASEGLTQHAPVVVEIRRALQPTPIDAGGFAGLQIAGRMVPAEGEIAGDWWDTIAYPDGRVALILVDVSGHGPAAALLAVALKAVLRAGLRTGQDPAVLLDGPAREVFTAQPDMFATAVIIELDPAANQLRWANAGHPPPLVLTAAGTVRTLDPTGPLISPITSGTSLGHAPFEAGDVLLAYTDGLVESPNAAGATVTDAVLAQALRESASAEGVLEAVLAVLERHTGRHRHSDDITVVSAFRTLDRSATNTRLG